MTAAETAEATAWRDALEAAAQHRDTLLAFRDDDGADLPSRVRLRALVDVFASAGPDARGMLLDWITALQPVDAAPWTLTEKSRDAPPGTPQDGDLDQPRSAAQRERLLTMLADPSAARRRTAAAALWEWPEPDIRLTLLRAYLRGDIPGVRVADLAEPLRVLDDGELRADHAGCTGGTEGFRQRVAAVAWHLDPAGKAALAPLLLDWWRRGAPQTREAAERVLRCTPADTLAEALREPLAAGAWGFLDLVAGRPLLRTPALAATAERLRAEGRADIANKLDLVAGPLHTSDDAIGPTVALVPAPTSAPPPTRQELITRGRNGDVVEVRRALTLLADTDTDTDGQLEALLRDLLGHRDPRIRLQAHRLSRRRMDQATHLRHTLALLDDPRPAVVRSAVRTLCHAGHEPAVPAVVRLLAHRHAAVRNAAVDGLVRIGAAALPALRHAEGHARPDHRNRYAAVVAQIRVADGRQVAGRKDAGAGGATETIPPV